MYRAVVYLVYIQGTGPRSGNQLENIIQRAQQRGEQPPTALRRLLSIIPPGRHRTDVSGEWGILSGRAAVEIAFTDRSGSHWLRAADGSLTEIERPPIEYYGIGFGPYDWREPTPG